MMAGSVVALEVDLNATIGGEGLVLPGSEIGQWVLIVGAEAAIAGKEYIDHVFVVVLRFSRRSGES